MRFGRFPLMYLLWINHEMMCGKRVIHPPTLLSFVFERLIRSLFMNGRARTCLLQCSVLERVPRFGGACGDSQ